MNILGTLNSIRQNTTASIIAVIMCAPIASAQSVLKDHDTLQPIDISAERLEVKQRDGLATFSGTVIVKQGRLEFNAEDLIVHYDLSESLDNPSIERLDARGKVKLSSSTETVTGDWGIYDVTRKLVTIGGNVVLERKDASLTGDRLELDLVSGLTKLDGLDGTTGRVSGTFSVPKDNKIQ